MSEMIVQKLKGLQFISPLLTSDRINLQTTAIGLLGNLAKNPNLHTVISKTQKLGFFELNYMIWILNEFFLTIAFDFNTWLFGLVKHWVGFIGHATEGTRAFPELVTVLKNGTDGVKESDDAFAMACQTASTLLLREPEFNKKYLDHSLINPLQHICRNK